jgi:two-component system OmpR family sensor kinase
VIRITGLLPRIYVVGVAQLLATVAAVLLVGYLSFRSERGPDFDRRGRYVVDTVIEALGEPAALQRELTRANEQMHAAMTVYAADGSVLASSVQPPLPPIASPAGQGPHHLAPPWLDLPLTRPPAPVLRFGVGQGAFAGAFVMLRPSRPQPPPGGLWTIGIALFATAIASIWLARSFGRPLQQLGAAARRFGAGDFSARAGLARSDEFGELARTFDDMAERVTQLVRSRQQLLADVSHELRTPLARIRVALDIAADGGDAPELARDALAEIGEDCAELEQLVNDVLQTARLELSGQQAVAAEQTLRKELFDAESLVQRAAERFRGEHPARRLELQPLAEWPQLYGDQVLLRRALSNLLDNAHKYSAEITSVSLHARVVEGQLELTVEDRGIGIAQDDLAQVGTPFFRTDRSRTRRTGGVGLGLSLARKIVEAHAGSLSIQSEADRGTRVCVRLPIARAS